MVTCVSGPFFRCIVELFFFLGGAESFDDVGINGMNSAEGGAWYPPKRVLDIPSVYMPLCFVWLYPGHSLN